MKDRKTSSLERLYGFYRVVESANLDPSSLSVEVLRQLCALMHAHRAQLILAETYGIPRRLSFTEGGASEFEAISLDDRSIITKALHTGSASAHGDVERRRPKSDPVIGEYRNAVVAPLMNHSTAIGAIVILDRDKKVGNFSADDLLLFELSVAYASATLERARLAEELRYEIDAKVHQATHDMLTGLPNRVLFLSRALAALDENPSVAIMVLDLDCLRAINHTHGLAMGDRFLCEMAERLRRSVSAGTTVARFGGDEFVLAIPGVKEPSEAIAIANELNAEVTRPFEIDGVTLAVSVTIGIALAPDHGDQVSLLLQRADIALSVARERQCSVEVYPEGARPEHS